MRTLWKTDSFDLSVQVIRLLSVSSSALKSFQGKLFGSDGSIGWPTSIKGDKVRIGLECDHRRLKALSSLSQGFDVLPRRHEIFWSDLHRFRSRFVSRIKNSSNLFAKQAVKRQSQVAPWTLLVLIQKVCSILFKANPLYSLFPSQVSLHPDDSPRCDSLRPTEQGFRFRQTKLAQLTESIECVNCLVWGKTSA